MQFKQTTDYAVRFIAYLAEKGKTAAASEISEKTNIPKAYLINFSKQLRQKGLIAAETGINGGYYLVKDPSEITMYDVISTVEITMKINQCLENEQGKDLYENRMTKLHDFYADLQDVLEEKLKSVTIADIVQKNI